MALPTRVARAFIDPPFDPAQREFDTLLNRFFNGREPGGAFAPYAVDVREDQDHIYVEAELPGYTKDEVDITLENSTLSISAERKSERNNGSSEKSGEYLLNERRYSRFLRSFTLPPTVDEGSVQASLKDGILTVVLNKREETKPRKVQVK